MNHEQVVTDHASELFWERASKSRWGQYISEVEERHIMLAHHLVGDPAHATEIGAEGGRWASKLANLGWKLTCTDIDQDALAVCQERIPDAKCICVDINDTTIPCDDQSQRLLLCIEVHEILETDWFMEESKRVLEPGGALVGVFQNRSSLRGFYKNTFPKENEPKFDYGKRYGPWKKKLHQNGFRVVEEEGLCWLPFGRRSNSPLIPAAVTVERMLGLRQLTVFSPWIVFVAQRLESSGPSHFD